MPKPAHAVTGEGAQGVVYGLHLFDELGIRVGARVGGEEPLLIREQDQQVRIRQDGGTGGEVVVVPTLISAVATASFSLMTGMMR